MQRLRATRRLHLAIGVVGVLLVGAIGAGVAFLQRVVVPPTLPPATWREVLVAANEPDVGFVVSGGYAGPDGLILTGTKLGGPEEGIRPIAYHSVDGVSWSLADVVDGRPELIGMDIGPIYGAGDRLLALGNGGRDTGDGASFWTTIVLYESRDGGRSWRLVADTAPQGPVTVTDVVRGGPGYVAVGYGNGGDETACRDGAPGADGSTPGAVVWVSRDGEHWQPVDLRDRRGPLLGAFNAVERYGDLLVAVGMTCDGGVMRWRPAAWVSRDGVEWTRVPGLQDEEGVIRDVVQADGQLVAVGHDAAGPAAWWSADGASWVRIDLDAGGALTANALVALPGGLIAVGDWKADGFPQEPKSAVAWRTVNGRNWGPAEHLGEGAWAAAVLPAPAGVVVVGTRSPWTPEQRPVIWVAPSDLAADPGRRSGLAR